MKIAFWRVTAFSVMLASGVAYGADYLDPVAMPIAHESTAGPVRSFVTVTPVWQGNADLDKGGDFSMRGAVVRGGAAYNLGGATSVGLTLNYDYLDYSFSTPNSLGARAPWGIIQRFGFSVPLSFDVGDGWIVGATPSVDWIRENGANNGDSVTWGALVSGIKRFDDGNRLGLGVGVYDRIETTQLFPFLIVDWRLGDRWRIINPLPSGPTGPAGLELDYEFDGGWTAGIGAAYRVMRFRLSETGPTPNGIGEETGVPIFVRVSRSFSPQMALHLYAGAVVAGELRLENSSGGLLRKDDFDPALLLGATFVGRF